MSDNSFSDDELLSSHLDGELTAEEETRLGARLEAETALRARLDTMRAASTLVAAPPEPLRAGDRDRLLAAALAASSTAENVSDLGAARERRDKWRTRLITVAAGVAVLAITVPVLRSLDTGGNDAITAAVADTAPTAEQPDEDAGGDATMIPQGEAGAELESSAVTEAVDDLAAADNDIAPAEMSGAARSSLNALTGANPDFDPLPDDLGDFGSQSELVTALIAAAEDFAAPDEEPTDAPETEPGNGNGEAAEPDASARAAEYLDRFGGCGSAIDALAGLVEELPPVLAVDWSITRVDDISFTVGLFRLLDGQAVAVVIDQFGCTIGEPLFLS